MQLSPCGPDKESIPSLSIQKQHQQTTASKNSNQNKLTKFWKAFSIFNKPNLSLIVPYRESAGPPSQPSRLHSNLFFHRYSLIWMNTGRPSPPLLKKMQRGKVFTYHTLKDFLVLFQTRFLSLFRSSGPFQDLGEVSN